ncbi:3-isopropylmalate dehydrogenase [Streptococcus pneumoniae]|nr:3-isopropylmalate dehydrogenase [Streptococcus pneumoniae]
MAKKIVALVGDGIGPEIMEAGLEVLEALAEKQVLTMRLTDDRSDVQILMQQDLPYLMKPLRQVGKQMLSY